MNSLRTNNCKDGNLHEVGKVGLFEVVLEERKLGMSGAGLDDGCRGLLRGVVRSDQNEARDNSKP